MTRLALLAGALVLVGAGCGRAPDKSSAPATSTATSVTSPQAAAQKEINLAALPGAHEAFQGTLTIPAVLEVEVVPELEAINLYDPEAPGGSPRERSQIFLRHFRANEFLTLQTVDVLEQMEGTVAGRPAVRYIIEKKSGVPPFAGQPTWRNARHRVMDVRLSDASPSEFLVIAQNPSLPDAVFEQVLTSLRITP